MHHSNLSGLYHISSNPISKFDLLKIIDRVYGCHITIEPDFDFNCDRSLDSTRYHAETSFQPSSWEQMINEMHEDYLLYKVKNI